jgi:hypothetical protein
MAALVMFAMVIAILVVFDQLAVRYGVDSRQDADDPRYAPYRVGIS